MHTIEREREANQETSETVTDVPVLEEDAYNFVHSVEVETVESKATFHHSSQESNILKLIFRPDDDQGDAVPNYIKFRIIPNDIRKFGGDCLFMVLAQFLHPNSDPVASLNCHCLIRQIIVNFLTRDESDFATWKKYSIFLKDNHQSRIKEFRNYAPGSPCKFFHTKIQKAYKRYMLKEGNFGTMAELDAAMELFSFKTTLIQEIRNYNPSDSQLGAEKHFSVYNIGNSQCKHQLYLLFTGHSDNGHFQKLELTTDTLEVPVGNYQVDSHCQAHSFISLSKNLPPNPESEVKPYPNPSRFNEHKHSFDGDHCYHGSLQTTKKMKLEENLSTPPDTDFSILQQELNTVSEDPSNSFDLTKSQGEASQSHVFSSTNFCNHSLTEDEENSRRCLQAVLPAAQNSEDPNEWDLDQTPEYAVTTFHLHLPPWEETPFQVPQSRIRVHIVDNSFLLMDIATATTPAVKNLMLMDGVFDIQAGDTYSLKNVTDSGISMKILHLKK